LKRHREALVVVVRLPGSQTDRGRLEVIEAAPSPEFLLIDSMTPFDFAVLLRTARLDIPVADPSCLDGEREGERKLLPVVPAES